MTGKSKGRERDAAKPGKARPSQAKPDKDRPETTPEGKASPEPDPTRYGDWVVKGRAIDF